MTADARDVARLTDWHVEQFRLSVFYTKQLPALDEVPSLWKLVTKVEPVSESTRRDGPVKTYVAEAPYGTGHLQLTAEPNRMHWILLPQKSDEAALYDLAEYEDLMPSFRDLLTNYAANGTLPAQRLALGAVLMHPVPDRRAGYQFLQRFLPTVQLDVENSYDFFYRINRRRKLEAPGVDLNRISDWSTAQMTAHALNVSPDGARFAQSPEAYFGRLALDINTVPEYKGDFTPEQFGALFEQMLSDLEFIAKEGDVSNVGV